MFLINGLPAEQISVRDRGLHYGDGLFETMAVMNGELQHWDLHWQRLCTGCERLNLPVPDPAQLHEEIRLVMDNQSRVVIKLIYTRGAGGRGYRYSAMPATRVVMCSPWPDYPLEYKLGINLFLCQIRLAIQPRLAGIKHLNRLENVLARNEWQDASYAEGLMLSTAGDVIEGCMSNVFLVKDSELLTPDLSQCGVEGVMRRHLLGLAASQNIPVRITRLTMEDVTQADEMFVCNSLIGIWPVSTIRDKHFNLVAKTNPLTRQLQTLIARE